MVRLLSEHLWLFSEVIWLLWFQVRLMRPYFQPLLEVLERNEYAQRVAWMLTLAFLAWCMHSGYLTVIDILIEIALGYVLSRRFKR